MPTEIGIVVYPGAQMTAVHGLSDLFSLANRFAGSGDTVGVPPISVSLWQTRPASAPPGTSPVRSVPVGAPTPRILILPPTMVDLPEPWLRAALAAWMLRLHGDGVRLVTVCSGVALLAETGLLDGRAVSTHRNFARTLIEAHPAVIVDREERIIEYPDILTAGGFMSWVDVGLLLVERLLGEVVRARTGQFLSAGAEDTADAAPPRFVPPLGHGDAAIERAQRHAHLSDGRDVTVAAMAAAAGLSRRTFMRRFGRATGSTPQAYCQAVRLGRARELLEASALAPKEIAERLGYVDVSSFARAFRRVHGVPPAAYRQQARQAGGPT
jgi:transcriptional regulator GlxA family with amidase domain